MKTVFFLMFPQEILDMIVEHTRDFEIAKCIGSEYIINRYSILNDYVNSFEPEKYYIVKTESGKTEIRDQSARIKKEIIDELCGMNGTGEERITKYEAKYSGELDMVLRIKFVEIISYWVIPDADIEELFDIYKDLFVIGSTVSPSAMLFCFRFEDRLYLHDEDDHVPLPNYIAEEYAFYHIYTSLSNRFELLE